MPLMMYILKETVEGEHILMSRNDTNSDDNDVPLVEEDLNRVIFTINWSISTNHLYINLYYSDGHISCTKSSCEWPDNMDLLNYFLLHQSLKSKWREHASLFRPAYRRGQRGLHSIIDANKGKDPLHQTVSPERTIQIPILWYSDNNLEPARE